jgi:hypothetical protein
MADISKIQIESGVFDIKDETARNDIADLQIPRNFFKDRKFILIGDSYAVGEDGSGGIITSWEQLFIDYTGIASANVIKKAQGGAGFVNLGSNKNFQTLLEEVTASDDITDIVVLGGYNDRSYNSTQIRNAINSFRISANTRFPNAKIHVGYVGRCKIASNFYQVEESIGFYKDSCQYQAIHYLDGIEYSLHEYYANFGADGVHPNNVGQIYITFNLIQGLIGGSVQRQFNFKNINITPASGITLANASSIGCMMKGNVIEVSNQDDNFRVLFDPSITINPARTYWIEIGTMTTGYIWGSTYNMSLIPVRIITNSTEGYIESSGLIKFSGGKMYIGLGFHIDPDTGAYRKFTNLTEIKIDAFHGVLLADFC